jgi:hypothetical protein
MLTALLVAVSCQPVSAVAPKVDVPFSIMFTKPFMNIFSFVGNHKLAIGSTLAVSALLVAGYKYVTKPEISVDGSCIKFKKRNLFGTLIEEGSICYRTHEEAIDASKIIKQGRSFGGFSRLKEVAEMQKKSPDIVWSPKPMTPAEYQKFKKDRTVFLQTHDRIMKDAFGKFGW